MGQIYKIENLVTGDLYIGSSINFPERKRRHLKDLRKDKHHSIILQRAWNKYGSEKFQFVLIEECLNQKMEERENFYLYTLKPIYNICKIAYSTIGRVYTEVTRKKHQAYAKLHDVKPPASTYEKRRKAVQQIDKISNKILATFDSLSEACRSVGKDHTFSTTIADVCNNKRRKSAFGYKWKWK